MLNYNNLSLRKISVIVGSFGLFLSIFTIYISSISFLYNYDGVACAIAVELGNAKFLLHGNHLLYGFLGYLFHSLLNSVGILWRSIISLQLMNILLGCVSIVIFSRFIQKITGSILFSFIAGFGLAFSFCFWLWHIEAQVYPLGFIFLLLSSYILIGREYFAKKYVLVGLLHAFACLGHVVHCIWFPVVLAQLFYENNNTDRKQYLRNILEYTLTFIGTILIAYLIVIVIVVKLKTINELFLFLSGSAGLSGTFKWTGYPTFNRLLLWCGTELQALIGQDLQKTFWAPATLATRTLIIQIVQYGIIVVLGVVAFIAWLQRRTINALHKHIIKICIVWISIYAVFFSAWDPFNITYHQTDLIPLWIIIILCIQLMKTEMQRLAVLSLLVLLLCISSMSIIYPIHNIQNNPLLKKMYFIRDNTKPNDIIVISGGWEKVYVPYFAERMYITTQYRDDVFHSSIQMARKKGSRLFVVPDVAAQDLLKQKKLYYTIKNTIVMDADFYLTEIEDEYRELSKT